jgi:hypothetical protein
MASVDGPAAGLSRSYHVNRTRLGAQGRRRRLTEDGNIEITAAICAGSDAASALVYDRLRRGWLKPISPTRQLGSRGLRGGCGLGRCPRGRLARPGPIARLLGAGLLGVGPGTGLLSVGLSADLPWTCLRSAGPSLSGLVGGTSASRLLGCRFRCHCGHCCRLSRSATKPDAFGELGPPLGIIGSRHRIVRRQFPT